MITVVECKIKETLKIEAACWESRTGSLGQCFTLATKSWATKFSTPIHRVDYSPHMTCSEKRVGREQVVPIDHALRLLYAH